MAWRNAARTCASFRDCALRNRRDARRSDAAPRRPGPARLGPSVREFWPFSFAFADAEPWGRTPAPAMFAMHVPHRTHRARCSCAPWRWFPHACGAVRWSDAARQRCCVASRSSWMCSLQHTSRFSAPSCSFLCGAYSKHARTHRHTHSRVLTRAHTHTHTHMPACTNSYTLTHAHTRTRTCTRTHTHTHSHMHTHAHAHAHAHARTHTHTHITHTRAHTYAHTRTQRTTTGYSAGCGSA